MKKEPTTTDVQDVFASSVHICSLALLVGF